MGLARTALLAAVGKFPAMSIPLSPRRLHSSPFVKFQVFTATGPAILSAHIAHVQNEKQHFVC